MGTIRIQTEIELDEDQISEIMNEIPIDEYLKEADEKEVIEIMGEEALLDNVEEESIIGRANAIVCHAAEKREALEMLFEDVDLKDIQYVLGEKWKDKNLTPNLVAIDKGKKDEILEALKLACHIIGDWCPKSMIKPEDFAKIKVVQSYLEESK